MRVVNIHTATILILCLGIFSLPDTTEQYFAYYHNGIENGQLWRLLSAHLSHTNGYHLLLNSMGLLVVVSLFSSVFKKITLLPSFFFSALFISLCLFTFEKELMWYVGLSGVLHAFFAIGLYADLCKKERGSYLLGFVFVGKIAYEQYYGSPESTAQLIEASVFINAHLYGAIAGLIYSLLWRARQRVAMY